VLAVGGLLAGYWTLSSALVARGTWLAAGVPLSGAFVAALAADLRLFAAERRDRRFIHDALGRYTSPDLVRTLLERRDLLDRFGGAKQELTVYFSDIRGFTSVSEGMDPETLVQLLNEYLSAQAEIVEAHHGYVDKYVGDAIMALFPRQADDALEAAIAMLRALGELNVDLTAEGGAPLQIGIGLHYGQLMMGMVGVHGRMDGTVIGDAVNVASRIETSTRFYGLSLLLTAQVRDRLEFPHRFALRELDRVRVVGRGEPVTLFESFDADEPEMQAAKHKSLPIVARLIDHYRNGRLDQAATSAQEALAPAPGDRVAQLYLERCKSFAGAGLPANWDGVATLGQK